MASGVTMGMMVQPWLACGGDGRVGLRSSSTTPLALSSSASSRMCKMISRNRVCRLNVASRSSCCRSTMPIAPLHVRSTFSGPSVPFTSSFSGSSSFGVGLTNTGMGSRRSRRFVVRAGKAALCQTKRNRSRKSLARTHGFRRRMKTTRGRAVLKRRRAKGRKVLCTKTNPSQGKSLK